MQLNKNVKNMDISKVREIFETSKSIKNPINLTIGQPHFNIPNQIKKAAIKAIKENKNRYTSTTGIEKLKEQIKKQIKGELIITSSVSGGLSIILTTILNPKDEVIIPDPYFVSYKQLTIQNRAKPIFTKTKKYDYHLDHCFSCFTFCVVKSS